MYQPAHLDSFLRLLVSHLGSILSRGDTLRQAQSSQSRMDLLLDAIEGRGGELCYQDELDRNRESEILFLQQICEAREWVDLLGQLDPHVERYADEFLAATFSIEKTRRHRQEERAESGLEAPFHSGLSADINIDAMMCSIFELLGRLEEQYGLMEEFLEEEQVVSAGPSDRKSAAVQSARIIPLFSSTSSL